MQFVLSEYSDFVRDILNRGYECKSFADLESRNTATKNLMLRHDLDMDPSAAISMAKAEASIGARATYFVLLSNRHTNPFDVQFREAIRQLIDLGHWIGLHFDATQYSLNASSPEFSKFVMNEARWLSEICHVDVESVSFHRPSRDLLDSSPTLTTPFAHTYEKVFIRDIEYCSDSSGRWSYGPPEERDAINKGLPFHFLTHPIWWGNEGEIPLSRISSWMKRRVFDDFRYELPNEPNPFEENS